MGRKSQSILDSPMSLEPMAVIVRTVAQSSETMIDPSGSIVRKTGGIDFIGTTREDHKMYIIDCILEGYEGGQVSIHFITMALESLLTFCQSMWLWGEMKSSS